MKYVSHVVWFVRWLSRLGSTILRNRKVIDLLPSILMPRGRFLFDRRVSKFRRFALRKALSDYWAYDHCLAAAALDLEQFPQGKMLRNDYQAMLAAGRKPLILDCGANIGLSTYWFAVEFPSAQVIAVEPDTANVRLAMLNTRMCTNVTVVQAAVSAADTRVSLVNTNQGADAYRTVFDQDGDVDGFSIATLLAKMGADIADLLIVKVDIEGFENELFSSNVEWVGYTRALMVEPHDWMIPGCARSHSLLKVISDRPRDFLVHGEHVISFRLPS